MPTPPGLAERPREGALPKGVPEPGASPASPDGASNWGIQQTYNTPSLEQTNLYSVSCPSAKACEAVGNYDDGANALTLAELWNGKTWAVQPTPNSSSAGNDLNAVSCTTAKACEAVGYYSNGSNSFTLAELWNGKRWAIQPIPSPSGATFNELESVSCVTADSCMAVGFYLNDSAWFSLAELWNGTSWTIESTPDAGSGLNYLYGVSCTASDACVAVGSDASSSGYSTLAEVWNGSAWAVPSLAANPSGAADSYLQAVTCTAADACTAVGYYDVNLSSVSLTLAEVWNGTTWAIESTPDRSGATVSYLQTVSCTSTDACIGDGWYSNGSQTLPLAEDWNGSTWMIESIEDPFGNTGLYGVSCTSASVCEAVGNYEDGAGDYPLAYGWNGSQWAFQVAPNGASNSSLTSVSCTAADACVAVGYSLPLIGSDYSTLAESWSGTSWAVITPPPEPSGAADTYLESVSCTGPDACMAVGWYINGSDYETLAEAWNGSSWTLESTPNAGSSETELYGVSCTAANACEAVGNTSDGSEIYALAEVWNGTSWALQSSTLNPSTSINQLYGVSCTAADACTAVGSYDGGSGFFNLAEVWNGTSWAIQSIPDPAKTKDSFLEAVSCTAVDACVAVGSYSHKSEQLTVAEVWNGTSWAITSSPNPGASLSLLSGLSCSGANACVAVGYYEHSSQTLTLAEAWNGTTWSVVSTPNPAGAVASFLAGVWCSGATACAAVGTYDNYNSGNSLTLAEAEGGD